MACKSLCVGIQLVPLESSFTQRQHVMILRLVQQRTWKKRGPDDDMQMYVALCSRASEGGSPDFVSTAGPRSERQQRGRTADTPAFGEGSNQRTG